MSLSRSPEGRSVWLSTDSDRASASETTVVKVTPRRAAVAFASRIKLVGTLRRNSALLDAMTTKIATRSRGVQGESLSRIAARARQLRRRCSARAAAAGQEHLAQLGVVELGGGGF